MTDLADLLSTPPAWGVVLLVFAALLLVQRLVIGKAGLFSEPTPFLQADQWKGLPLVDKLVLNHNTRQFRFALPHNKQRAGLPVGKHITLRGQADGEYIFKPYTPVSDEEEHKGFIDFVIKVYPEGRMSQYMDHLRIGQELDFKGPKGRFDYSRNMKRCIGMLAGGTGITPMYQVARAILKDPEDHTYVSLIFGNLTADDILIKDLLDELASKHPDRFRVHYVLNTAPDGWTGGVGFITADTINQRLQPPADDVLIVRCGPPAMNKAMAAHLDVLGYTKAMQFEF